MKSRTVNFDEYNSLYDLGIIFTTLNLGTPTAKTVSVNIPYGDGALDLTDYYGGVSYSNRAITMHFFVPANSTDHMGKYHNVLKLLNGKRRKIVFSADQAYYYYGRLAVSNYAVNGSVWSFDITADCDPYQYQDITKTKSITTSGSIDLAGGVKSSKLSVTSSATATLSYGTTTINLSAGTQTISLALEEGHNYIGVTGTTNLTIEYTIGRL